MSTSCSGELKRKDREPNLHYQKVGIVYNVKGVWLFDNFNTSQHKVVSMSEMHMCTILLLLHECISNNFLLKYPVIKFSLLYLINHIYQEV